MAGIGRTDTKGLKVLEKTFTEVQTTGRYRGPSQRKT